MSDTNNMGACVDCGTIITICEHAIDRLKGPELSYYMGLVEDLQAENKQLRQELASFRSIQSTS